MTDLLTLLGPQQQTTSLIAPPDGRMWKFSLVWRGPPAQRGQGVGEFTQVRARKLHLDLYGPATAEFVVDGRSSDATLIQEMYHDLIVQRFDPYPTNGGWTVLFRGPFARSEDTISATTHTVNFAAADYRAMLNRCVTNVAKTYSQVLQESIFADLVGNFSNLKPPPFDLGAAVTRLWNPDGTSLGSTGVRRDRTYTGAEKTGDMLTNLSQVINGFDFELTPWGTGYDRTFTPTIWYPQRGVTKSFVAEYGATVESLTRTVNSTDFANWVRFDGTNSAPGTPVYAISPGDVMVNPGLHAEGLWMAQQSAADVSVSTTLQQQSDGYLALHSQIIPSYTLQLVPGAWNGQRDCWLGDTIELRIKSGRLNVDTSIRIVGIDFDINDEGQERIALIVGRSDVDFTDVMAGQRNRLDALSRR
jgi:hypothetical protein